MNKKPTKLRETSGYNKDRHPSQNDFPPIDKFHPDWWYYRQEMEEPVEIDDNYKNESRHMNKKLIRLTESDLHRIVKESVNKILSEAINELDPRTYASYAQKRAAQGQDGKAMSGQFAARDAWNKQYGENDMQFNGFGDRKDSTFAMNGNDYNVRQTTSMFPSSNSIEQDNSFSTQTYNPYNDTGYNTYVRRNKYTGDETQRGDNSLYNPQAAFHGKRRQGIDVARQMAQGNGKYVKGKGWQ